MCAKIWSNCSFSGGGGEALTNGRRWFQSCFSFFSAATKEAKKRWRVCLLVEEMECSQRSHPCDISDQLQEISTFSVRWCFNISASSSSGDVHTAVAEVNAEFCFLHKRIIFHSVCTNPPKFYFTESILPPWPPPIQTLLQVGMGKWVFMSYIMGGPTMSCQLLTGLNQLNYVLLSKRQRLAQISGRQHNVLLFTFLDSWNLILPVFWLCLLPSPAHPLSTQSPPWCKGGYRGVPSDSVPSVSSDRMQTSWHFSSGWELFCMAKKM